MFAVSGVAARHLPPFDPAQSDGCSSFGRLLEWRWPAARPACVRHDEAYYYGGSWIDRWVADETLRLSWIAEADMPLPVARTAWLCVRAFGAPSWRAPRSWAFGGGHFAYEPTPAIPDTDR